MEGVYAKNTGKNLRFFVERIYRDVFKIKIRPVPAGMKFALIKGAPRGILS